MNRLWGKSLAEAPMYLAMPMRRLWGMGLLLVGACASGGNPSVLYERGMDAFGSDQMKGAAEAFEGFVGKSCQGAQPDKRCRTAYLKLGHARERLGANGPAWTAYDAALALPPHTRDEAVQADLERVQKALIEGRPGGDLTPVVILYKDEVDDGQYSARSVVISLDFAPVVTKEKDVGELHLGDFRRVYGGSVPSGEHVLLVEAVHDCKPGGGPCARSKLRRAWPFQSAGHDPKTIEIRAFATTQPGDSMARPAVEFGTR
jgi:hypothetical protein